MIIRYCNTTHYYHFWCCCYIYIDQERCNTCIKQKHDDLISLIVPHIAYGIEVWEIPACATYSNEMLNNINKLIMIASVFRTFPDLLLCHHVQLWLSLHTVDIIMKSLIPKGAKSIF